MTWLVGLCLFVVLLYWWLRGHWFAAVLVGLALGGFFMASPLHGPPLAVAMLLAPMFASLPLICRRLLA